MAVLTGATILLSRPVLGFSYAGLASAIAPPAAAALVMAAGVGLMLRVLPEVPDIAALASAVLLGVGLYLGALQLIAPDRMAEALHFLRNRGEAEPAPAE
jgi:hypothetical protein